MSPLIDVVIPTRDRPEALVACLEALARQTVEDVHVIVVDDGSTVPVADVLNDDLRSRLQLTLLRHEVSRGPAAARNLALRHGDAPYVAFVDDDVRCIPTLLASHLEAIRAAGHDHVIIGPLSAPPDWDALPWTRWEAQQLDAEYARMERGEYPPSWRQFHTGNAFLTRSAIEATDAFDERFTRAEDVEFALRLAIRGARFVFNAEAVGWHYSSRTLAAWMRIPRAYAEFDALLDRMYPDMHWLKTVDRERRRRHPILRGARLLGRVPGLRNLMVAALTHTTALLPRQSSTRVPMAMLSIAYDLQYEDARARARAVSPGAADHSPNASRELA